MQRTNCLAAIAALIANAEPDNDVERTADDKKQKKARVHRDYVKPAAADTRGHVPRMAPRLPSMRGK